VHRVASLAKRWLMGTHQGSVDPAHLPGYLDEFVFRFNRRRSASRGLVFCRLLELAAGHDPVRYRDLAPLSPGCGRRPHRRGLAGTHPAWTARRLAGRGAPPARTSPVT
jgi:hypothetical protein